MLWAGVGVSVEWVTNNDEVNILVIREFNPSIPFASVELGRLLLSLMRHVRASGFDDLHPACPIQKEELLPAPLLPLPGYCSY